MNLSERIAHAINSCGKKPGVIAKEAGVSAARISQLADPALGSGIKAELLYPLARATGYSPQWLAEGVGPQRPVSPEEEDLAMIPAYTAKGSAGNGYLNDHVEVIGGIAFRRDWLRQQGLKEPALRIIRNHGISMWPTLGDDDILLLDESQSEPRSGGIYAILRPDGELIIKRLVHTLTNGWLIRSDNGDKMAYPDEVAQDTEIGHLRIVGRVVWHGGSL